jgi:hypothetical protein
MKSPDELRQHAIRYRRLAMEILDQRAAVAITGLATEHEQLATDLENRERAIEREQAIRRRAYLIWEEQGRPHGLHATHWRDAERELAEEKEKCCRSES